MLYTQDTSGTGLAAHHNSVVIDNYTPISSGTPIFTPVWDYLLGLCPMPTPVSSIYPKDLKIKAYPNPAKDKVKIESENIIVRIEVINVLGLILDVYKVYQKRYRNKYRIIKRTYLF